MLHLWRRRPPQGAVPSALVRAQDGLRKLVEFLTVCVVQKAKEKAKAHAKAEEKVVRVKERVNFWNSPSQMGIMEESEYSQLAYSDYEWQQLGLLRQVNKRENDIKKIKVQKEILKPLFNFELLRSKEEGAENLSIGQSPQG